MSEYFGTLESSSKISELHSCIVLLLIMEDNASCLYVWCVIPDVEMFHVGFGGSQVHV